MTGKGVFRLASPEMRVIVVPTCPHCKLVDTECKCGYNPQWS